MVRANHTKHILNNGGSDVIGGDLIIDCSLHVRLRELAVLKGDLELGKEVVDPPYFDGF